MTSTIRKDGYGYIVVHKFSTRTHFTLTFWDIIQNHITHESIKIESKNRLDNVADNGNHFIT